MIILIIVNTILSDDDEEIIVLDGIEIEFVDDDEFETMPEIIEFVEADYPEELRDAGIRGNVLLEIIVGETGEVDSVSVIQSLHPVLDTNAMNAVRQFRFSPARIDGEYVAVMLHYEYRFHFEDVVVITEIDDTTNVSMGDGDIVESVQDAGSLASGDLDDDDAYVLDESFELTVYGREPPAEVSYHRLTIAEVKRIPGLGGEALRVVQAMPGVARPSFGGNEVIVRGAPSWASRYYVDGVSVPLLYHIGGNTSSYPSEAVEAVHFYPGGFSSRYGGAVGGVIEMTSRESNSDSLRGYIDLSMLDGALFIEGPINEKVSFMASARRGFAGDLLALYFKHFDPIGVSMAPYYWDYLLRTDVKINENHNMFVTLMGSRDSVGVFVPSLDVGSNEIDDALEELNLMVMFHTLIVGLNSRINDKWENTLRLSYSYASSRMSAFGFGKIEEKDYIGYLRNQITYTHNDNLAVNVGADVELISMDLSVALGSAQNIILRDTIAGNTYGMIGGYANLEWKPTERLLLIPGIRYDYYPELEHPGVLGLRVSGRYEFIDGHTAKAATGTYSQAPEPFGLVIHDMYGEPDLPATRAAQYVAGYEWQINDLLNLDVQGYYNHIWNIPRSYDNRIDYNPASEIQRRFFDDGRRRMYGIELMLRHSRSDRFFGWVSYTLSRSETWSKLDDKYILSSNDEPHHLQLLGSWMFKNNFDFGVRARFVSGKPTSPIIGTVEDENRKSISPVYGERNSTRHSPFFQVDMRVDKKVEYSRWALTYYVDFQNVLWPLYKSPEFTLYNYNYTEKQVIAMIPMIALGFRAEF